MRWPESDYASNDPRTIRSSKDQTRLDLVAIRGWWMSRANYRLSTVAESVGDVAASVGVGSEVVLVAS